MSWHVMDYLPFDYNRYIGEILPLLRQAQAGDLRPLLHLVRSVRSFSLWPLFRQPRPFPQTLPGFWLVGSYGTSLGGKITSRK
jgi:hypothetical protein